ncbi:hypothetical protein Ahy_A05g025843 [Arachis hypogaea]|uniref:RNase H type-1 domain-containing protein n=1 Tax=Arachis hypogaea TaxID=3818 RepID=A0A445D9N2_ARAHY|nr:hypothetical protein Ahy_A05g025843 [Arachis hypogaea]
MHAELWGIVCGLQIALANNISFLVVESDSIAAVNFIKKGHNSSHPCASLLDDIVVFASRVPYISWSHCLREANFAADILAKKGHDFLFDLHLFEVVPSSFFFGVCPSLTSKKDSGLHIFNFKIYPAHHRNNVEDRANCNLFLLFCPLI